jgi:cell division protein FtsL
LSDALPEVSPPESEPGPPEAAAARSRAPRFGVVLLGLLLAAVLGSALGVVYTKHLSRKLFIQLQELQAGRDQALEQWSRLLLEQSTWSTHGRIDAAARQQLGMVVPEPESVVIVKP